jgi:predicted metal-binding membrane protein
VLAGLAVITGAAWAYLVVAARPVSSGPAGMSGRPMAPVLPALTGAQPWTAAESGLRLAMWAVMMVAMMVPTAVPMTLLYAAVARKAAAQHSPVAPAFVLVAGYTAMWALFALAATAAQWGLDQAALLSPMMISRSAWLGAALLIAAGIYQLTPLKNACLRNCRAPAHVLSRHWRHGRLGALRMGVRLGASCLGCCWILMGLLFIGGVMNLLWIAAIAAFILLEKTLPFGVAGGRAAGAAMILIGALSIAA